MMRRRLAALALSAGLMLGATQTARADDPPLFAAFLKFCVASGAVPETVKTALDQAGAAPIARAAGDPPPGPRDTGMRRIGPDLKSWAGADVMAMGGTAKYNTEFCAVASDRNDDASVAAMRAWAAIQPNVSGDTRLTTFFYVYSETNGVRTSLLGDDAGEARAAAQGTLWELVVDRGSAGAIVFLNHMRGPADAKAAP